MSPQHTTPTRKSKSTRVEVKRKVKAARVLIKADPKITIKGAAKHVGLAPMTLSKYLKTRVVKVKRKTRGGSMTSLIAELKAAEAGLALAKRNLRDFLSI